MRYCWHHTMAMASLAMAVFLTGGCSHGGPTKDDVEKVIRLQVAANKYISVPLSGPFYDEEAVAAARKIDRTSNDLIDWQEAGTVKNIDVERAMLEVAHSMRWEAAKNIDLAYRVAKKTSGPLDPGLIENATKLADDVKALLKTQPPDSVFVATNISTSVGGAELHYMSLGNYNRQKKGGWSSYLDGQVMRIGRYMFRVQPPSLNQDIYQEIVLIISDPTRLRLVPVVGEN